MAALARQVAPARHVTIDYAPRDIFLPFHNRKQRWSIEVAHRRAGKTVARINDLIKRAIECPLVEPHFAYVAPTYAQAKDIAWSYLKRFTAPIPEVETNEAELRIDLPSCKSRARIRLYGAETYDRMRGIYLDGVVLDEYGMMDPRAWPEVIRPALSDRKGWGDFIGSANGYNHFHDLYFGDSDKNWHGAVNDPDWYCAIHKASETGLLDEAELADARKTMTPEQYEQEYECSFQAAVVGAYYGREMAYLEKEKRIGKVPWEPAIPVHTAWDLGIGDSTSIWFVQVLGRELRWIDFIENSGVGLAWYANELRSRPYSYGDHILPHDAQVRELGSGESRVETLAKLGIRVRVIPAQRVEDGINAVRNILPRSWFDEEKTKHGRAALRQYRREYDDKRKVFQDKPLHDWTSHAADAARTFAMGQPKDDRPGKLKYSNAGIV